MSERNVVSVDDPHKRKNKNPWKFENASTRIRIRYDIERKYCIMGVDYTRSNNAIL